jgi:hypothetical protein
MPKKTQDQVAADVFGSDRDREVDDEVVTKKPGEDESRTPVDDDRNEANQREEDENEDGEEEEEQDGTVPLKEHIRERKKLKATIDGFQSQFDSLKAELQARDVKIATLEGRVSATPQPRQRQMAPPDPRRDPAGALHYELQQFKSEQTHKFLNNSERRARKSHTSAVVDEAIAAAKQAGIFHDFAGTDDPYDELVDWHTQHKSMSRLQGKSLDDLEKEIRADERKKALEEIKKNGGTVPSLPGSLAASTRAGTQGGHVSQNAVAKSVFGSNRDRKTG